MLRNAIAWMPIRPRVWAAFRAADTRFLGWVEQYGERFTWRRPDRIGGADTREEAGAALLALAPELPPASGPSCAWCGEGLAPGSTRRRRFCGAPCRVAAARAREADLEQPVRVRAASTRRTMSRAERLAARARARVDVP